VPNARTPEHALGGCFEGAAYVGRTTSSRTMTAFLRAAVLAAARLSTDELTFVLNQMLGLELPERLLARGQRAPCCVEVDRGGVHLLNCVRCAQVTKAHDLVQGWVRRQARGAGLTVTVTGNSGFPAEMDPAGGVHRRPDIALHHDAFNPIPGVRVPFYRDRLRGLALDVSLVSSAAVDDPRSPPRPRPYALKRRHAEKMGKHGLWCSRQGWGFASLVVSTAGVPHADSLRFLELLASQMVQAIGAQRAGMDVDNAGAVMGASAPQMRGAVLGRLKAEFSLVAMKAGCLHAFEALQCGGGAAVPTASAAALPGVGGGAGSSAFGRVRGPGGARGGGLGGRWVVCGRAGRCRVRRLPAVVFSRSGSWFFPVLGSFACLSVWFVCMIPGLYEAIQYTLSLSLFGTRSVRGYSIHPLSLTK